MFLYVEGPHGRVFEYPSGVRSIAPEAEASYQPRQFPRSPASFCLWGSVPDIAEFRSAMPVETRKASMAGRAAAGADGGPPWR